MGKKGTKAGVVNPDLTVKGASNLRVVDASIFVRFFPISILSDTRTSGSLNLTG